MGPIAGRWSDPKCLFLALLTSLLGSKVSLLPKLPHKEIVNGFSF